MTLRTLLKKLHTALFRADIFWMWRYYGKKAQHALPFWFARLFGKEVTSARIGGKKILLTFTTPYHHHMARDAAHGIVEPHLMQLWIERAKSSARIYDIGGFNGLFGLVAASVNPSAEVRIFEPDPLNVEHIKRNIAQNNLSNCTVEQIALTDHRGTERFNFEGTTYSLLGKGRASSSVVCSTIILRPSSSRSMQATQRLLSSQAQKHRSRLVPVFSCKRIAAPIIKECSALSPGSGTARHF